MVEVVDSHAEKAIGKKTVREKCEEQICVCVHVRACLCVGGNLGVGKMGVGVGVGVGVGQQLCLRCFLYFYLRRITLCAIFSMWHINKSHKYNIYTHANTHAHIHTYPYKHTCTHTYTRKLKIWEVWAH